MNPKIEKAFNYAKNAHKNQKRKYTREDYFEHCWAVARKLTNRGFQEDVICAALLHDVVEDTDITISEIESEFGILVGRMVDELTDVYTSKAYPAINRKERKKLEAYRLSSTSFYVKSIKLADLIDNTVSICENDKDFGRVYLKEKEELLKVLIEGDPILHSEAVMLVKKYKEKLYESS